MRIVTARELLNDILSGIHHAEVKGDPAVYIELTARERTMLFNHVSLSKPAKESGTLDFIMGVPVKVKP